MRSILLSFVIFFSITLCPQSKVPEWAKGIVWYQIFPERFANGDSTNDPTPDKVFINDSRKPKGWAVTPWTSGWFRQANWEKALNVPFREHVTMRRYGGDIQGIINRLDYLEKLGVGAIYLNPVFEAVSLHKYDGSTYHHIDVNFGPSPESDYKTMAGEIPDDPSTWKWTGADSLFLVFLKEAHKRNIRVVIDGVFNHTGVQFWAFQDIIRNGKNSKYYDWYQIKQVDDPNTPANEFDYKGWWNVKSLPEFNRTKDDLHPAVKEYIFSATKRWMDPNGDGDPSDGIDGWRLDVAREVPIGFWDQWKKVVKGINPDALIIGELWELSPDFVSVTGPFDALMNYNFAYAVNKFFIAQKKKISSEQFIAMLKEIERTYPPENQLALQNLLSSHDTERLSSMIQNPDREYENDGNEQNPYYDVGKPLPKAYELQKVISAFQFLYKGSPMIYYGDEAGMWGADDPHDRKPMVWEDMSYEDEVVTNTSGFKNGIGTYPVNVEKDLLLHYTRLGNIRKQSEALRTGTVQFIPYPNNDEIIVFTRESTNEKYICYFNLSSDSELIEYQTDAVEVVDMQKGDKTPLEKNGILRFMLWGNSYACYKIK